MFLKYLALFTFLVVSTSAFADTSRPEKPNVIIVLTDDLGWQDVKCYDVDEESPFETPNIDQLAKKGVMFWQAYSPAPTCAPSRCAIMSGNHPARAQKTHVVGGRPPVPYNEKAHRMMAPWYSGRMPANELTLARVLQQNGYRTGHVGKWHMAIGHHAFPGAKDQGFDWSKSNLGVTLRMKPDRLSGFSTSKQKDKFALDENGFSYHQNNEDALTFIRESQDKPFFLYYATWLVHTPIQTRNKALLDKYCKKLNVELPENPDEWKGKGQTNPFYCAMVEELDYYVGQIFDYLNTTDDSRWPGHKLIENTYVIFTSDNGGMERTPGEVITDNYPLDRGKISAREGGTRVPLIITGPDIKPDVQSDTVVNGLDFYPTILSLAKIDPPKGKRFDGCDLRPLLLTDPTDSSLIKHADGQVRDTMVWHFPNSIALESTIRVGDYKLIRKYVPKAGGSNEPWLQLYQLYDSQNGSVKRVDIEEVKNLAASKPELAQSMDKRLTEIFTEMKASYPYFNPLYKGKSLHKDKVCKILSHEKNGKNVNFRYEERGAQVAKAILSYTLNGGQKYEEWYIVDAEIGESNSVTATLPDGTTHYFIHLVDENNFLVSYPKVTDQISIDKRNPIYSTTALVAQ